MKIVKSIWMLGVIFMLASFTQKDIQTLDVKTSAVCDMCKERLERELVFEKGIKHVNVDLASKTIQVKYRTGKTTPDNIRKAIAKMGYWADEVPAEEAGFNKLPECCKAEGCGKK